jgi:hypothetical protein
VSEFLHSLALAPSFIMTEQQHRAKKIYIELGPIDGDKHIHQLLYFIVHDATLTEYWKQVLIEFNLLKKNKTWMLNNAKKDLYSQE